MSYTGTIQPQYSSLAEKGERTQWLKKVQRFAAKQIKDLGESKEIYQALVRKEPMKIWEAAFTHKSVNPNIGSNYETLEAFGDKIVGAVFVNLFLSSRSDATPSDVTDYTKYFMSKDYQAKFAKDMGLLDLVRSNVPLTPKIQGDLFEAFFGALTDVADNYYQGLGYLLSYKLMEKIFKDIEFGEIDVQNPKTGVKETLEKAQLPLVQAETTKTANSLVQFNLYLPSETAQVLGWNSNEPFVSTTASTKEPAEREAYRKAYEYLQQQGYTKKWADRYKEKKVVSTPEMVNVYERAKNKAEQQGQSTITFQTFSTFDSTVAQLLGIDSSGKYTILSTATGTNTNDAKKNALVSYSE